jgi:ABC-type phosphate transport system substrate-binding protein
MRDLAHTAVCLCLVAGLLLVPAGAAVHAQRVEAIAVIANPSAGVTRLDRHTLAAIFALSMRHWDNGRPIVPFNYPPRHTLRSTFDRTVLSMNADEVALFWISQRVRGRGSPPRAASTPQLMLRVVENLKGAIGYVPATLKSDRVVVVATISPEGRVTKGAP